MRDEPSESSRLTFLILITTLAIAVTIRPRKWHLITGIFLTDAAFLDSLRRSYYVVASCIGSLQTHSVVPLNALASLPAAVHGVPEHLEFSLLPLWSLSVEEWFYILWAPIVLKLRPSSIVQLSTLIIPLCFFLRWFGFQNSPWYFSFCSSIDTLAMGGLLALWVAHRGCRTPERQKTGDTLIAATSIMSALALFAILIRIGPILGHEPRSSVLFASCGMTLIGVIIVGCLNAILRGSSDYSLLSRTLRCPPLVWIGQRSYMVYLAHMPIYFLVDRFCASVLTPEHALHRWIVAVVSLSLSLTIATISWRFFENPILESKEQWTALLVKQFHRVDLKLVKPA